MINTIKHLVSILLTICTLVVTASCTKENDDLSFQTIVLGKEFPEDLVKSGSFKFEEYRGDEQYVGTISFDFPSSKNSKLKVFAGIDPDTKKVYEICISSLNLSQTSEFYDMLWNKYGDPESPYCDYKDKFRTILLNAHDYGRSKDKYDNLPLAVWHPNGPNSFILISEPYFSPEERDNFEFCVNYVNQEASDIAKEKVQKIRESEYEQKEKNKRERYKETHPFMNQDF